MELKYGEDAETKRSLLKRACSLGLKPKIMKGFFTKWLEFETKIGDNKKINQVKSLATKYIEGAIKSMNAEDGQDEEGDGAEIEV